MFISRSDSKKGNDSFSTLKQRKQQRASNPRLSQIISTSPTTCETISSTPSSPATPTLGETANPPQVDTVQEFEIRKVQLLGACRKAIIVLQAYINKLVSQPNDTLSDTASIITMKERLAIKTQVVQVTKEIRVLSHMFEYFFKNKCENDKYEKEVQYLENVVNSVVVLNEEFIKIQKSSSTAPEIEKENLHFDLVNQPVQQLDLAEGIKHLLEKKEKKDGNVLDRQSKEEYLKDTVGLLLTEFSHMLDSPESQ